MTLYNSEHFLARKLLVLEYITDNAFVGAMTAGEPENVVLDYDDDA